MELLSRPSVRIGGATLGFGVLGFALVQILRDIVVVALILVIIALAAVLIVMWLRQRSSGKAKQASAEIESTLIKQADEDIGRSMPAQAASLENLKAELVNAIQSLRASKRGGEGALSLMPWYLVLGPAGSGKGTMVQRSGLNFPLKEGNGGGPRAVKGVGGTRQLEWWLSEEAVLLEMPGKLLAGGEFGDNDDWHAFLGVLKKHRPRNPVNGVLLPVAVDQVAGQRDADIDKLGRRMRERVQELTGQLGVSFPTYLAVTKCDQISGFPEFFAELPAEQRAQPWGASFSVRDARERAPDALFDDACRELHDSVAQRWMSRLPSLPDEDQRARVFGFPLQLQRLQPSLRRLIRAVYDSGTPGEKPLFRGFYFTSAAPGGGGVDLVFKPVTESLGIAPAAVAAPAMPAGGSWFVHDLFTKVIFPDRNLVTDSDAEKARHKAARRLLFLSLGIALLALTFTFSFISCANQSAVNGARKAALQLRQVSLGGDFQPKVEAIDALRGQIVRLEALRGRTPWWRHLGGYWGDDVIEPALRAYADHTLRILVKPALPRIENDVNQATLSPNAPFLDTYVRYWGWRLLRKPSELSPGDAPVVAYDVRRGLAPEIAGIDVSKRPAIEQMIEHDVAFLGAHAGLAAQFHDAYTAGEPDALLKQSSDWLRQHWDAAPFYDFMIRQPAPRAMTLEALSGKTDLFHAAGAVPGPYTLEGWQHAVRPRIAWFRARMAAPWAVEEFGDRAKGLAGQLEATYAQRYTAAWSDFLNGLDARKSTSWQTSVSMLNAMAQDGSPLYRLLDGAGRETNFGVAPGEGVGKAQQDFEALQRFELAASEQKKPGLFVRLFGMIFKKKPKAGTFDAASSDKQNYRQLLKNLIDKVNQVSQANASTQAYDQLFIGNAQEAGPFVAYANFAQELLGKYQGAGTDGVVRALWLPLEMLPVPAPARPRRGAPAAAPVAKAGAAPGAAAGHMPPAVNAAWQSQVIGPFNATLAGKYPFAGAGPDASLNDFAGFFGPTGVFWKFYAASLANYVHEDGTPAPGAEALVSPELARIIVTARDIRDAFFANGPMPSLGVRVRPSPPTPVAAPGAPAAPLMFWIDLEIGGQPPVHYTMGQPAWSQLAWPGPQPDMGAGLKANAGGAVLENKAPGVWGFFRLLDQGKITALSPTTTQAQMRVAQGQVEWMAPYDLELPGSSPHHPFKKNFLRFRLPSSI